MITYQPTHPTSLWNLLTGLAFQSSIVIVCFFFMLTIVLVTSIQEHVFFFFMLLLYLRTHGHSQIARCACLSLWGSIPAIDKAYNCSAEYVLLSYSACRHAHVSDGDNFRLFCLIKMMIVVSFLAHFCDS